MKIKNILLTLLVALISIVSLSSCGGIVIQGEKNEISLIAPTGTPTLILSQSIKEYGRVDRNCKRSKFTCS